jgi:phytoene dehydrogenase-like protein
MSTEIVVRDGKVTGVRLAGARRLPAASVLASVAPGQLYDRLLRDVNLPEDKAAAKTFRHGRGNFQLHYALDRPPEWLTPGLDHVALIHLSDGIDACRNPRTRPSAACCPRRPRSASASRTGWTPARCPKARRSSGCRSPMRRA